jgi:hypothetical protein
MARLCLVVGSVVLTQDRANAQPPPTLNITGYNFGPQTGGFNAEWPGPPRHLLRYDEVKHYVPSFSVQGAPAARITVNFWIMEERTLWDATLGMVRVEFEPSGAVTIRYPSRSGNGQAPQGAPATTTGTFWLGCTEKGRVRGNEAHSDDGHARVYLKMFEHATGGNVFGPTHSPSHDVRCVD